VKIAGVCDTTPPPCRSLDNGAEVLCHHTSEKLVQLQRHVPAPRRDTQAGSALSSATPVATADDQPGRFCAMRPPST
jgi:hypothetical protein